MWLIQPDGLVKAGTYKLPRTQSDLEKCVAHSGGLVPVPGRFIIAQAWLEGGVSVVDLTDPAAPVELTWFDRPDYGYSMDYTAGIWSVYHYDGYLYASDMYEGLRCCLTDPVFADAARYDDTGLNPQTQPAYSWVWREAPVVPTAAAERAPLETLSVEPAALEPADPRRSRFAAARLPHAGRDGRRVVDADAGGARDGRRRATSLARPPSPPGPLEPGRYDVVVRATRPRRGSPSRASSSRRPAAPDAAVTRATDGGAVVLVLLPFGVALAYHAAMAWRRRRRMAPVTPTTAPRRAGRRHRGRRAHRSRRIRMHRTGTRPSGTDFVTPAPPGARSPTSRRARMRTARRPATARRPPRTSRSSRHGGASRAGGGARRARARQVATPSSPTWPASSRSPRRRRPSRCAGGWSAASADDARPHEHAESMAGEISRSTIDRAAELEGGAFDRLFVSAMIPHHRGALQMSEARLAESGDPAVARWARAIATSQALEIDRLLEIEARLPAG